MHDSRQRRSLARRVASRPVVLNALVLAVVVVVAAFLIPGGDEGSPSAPVLKFATILD